MNTNRSSAPAPDATRSPDALFNAPGWAAKLLTIAAMLGVLAVVALAVGVGLAVVTGNAAPVALGLVLAGFCAFPALILQSLTRRSLGVMYDAPRPAPGGPQQTVLVLERGLNVAGQRHEFGQDRITVNAPSDEVGRMLQWIKAHPDRTSRVQVTTNAGVSQNTWQRVMSALEEVGAVANGGKSGYTVIDSLDAKLDKLDARF